MFTRKPQHSRLWPVLVAAVLFLGSIASNLVGAGLEEQIAAYRPWLIGLTGLAFAVALWVAFRDGGDAAAPDPLDRRQAAAAYTDLRQRYLAQVARQYQYLPLSAVDVKAASAETGEQERLRLADVYVAMDTTSRKPASRQPGEPERMALEQRDEPLSVLEALIANPRLVLLGDPGGGKSTFVNHLAFCLASHELDPRRDWLGKLAGWPQDKAWAHLLPVPVVLRELAAWLQETQPPERKAGLLEGYLTFWLAEAGLDDFQRELGQHLRDGTAILLLDGFDEVPLGDDTLDRVRELLTALPAALPQTRLIVTCRVLSYQDRRWQLDPTNWPTVELAKLSEAQIDGFIQAWHSQLAAMQVVKQPAVLDSKLSRAVRRPELWRLARNPLLLTVMALVHTHDGELPDARVLLYKKVVELLLWRWEAVKLRDRQGEETTWRKLLQEAGVNYGDIEQLLWDLAWRAHEQMRQSYATNETPAEATADIAESELHDALCARYPDPEGAMGWADQMVRLMKVRAGLLEESRPHVYRFPHRTFQEYLAACHLSGQADFTAAAVQLAGQGPYWWPVILLAVGRWVYDIKQIDTPLGLVSELCPATPPTAEDNEGWRKIWLAGQCLLEISLQRTRQRDLGRTLTERLRSHLTYLITHDLLTPRERAEAGSVLGVLGDPRDLEEMVRVPGGEFIMGSTEEERQQAVAQALEDLKDNDTIKPEQIRQWYTWELPQHLVTVDDFRISKYPVTNAQYARFITATGHEPPRHWRGTTPPPELLTHPVVYVTWHDAQTYCAWLSQERGETMRLLTEAEWEKAARGSDARLYPWGNTFDPLHCNMFETGVGATSPVGIFATGVAPCGAFDLLGNVWEWTNSAFKEYPYSAEDGREKAEGNEARVLRGGSFAYNQRSVRCAFRSGDDPVGRFNDSGIRVMSPGF